MPTRRIAVAFVVLLAGCVTGEPPPGAPRADQPRHTIGSEWVFRERLSETGVHWAYWYAPEVMFLTKVRVERTRESPRGPGRVEWDLVRYTLK